MTKEPQANPSSMVDGNSDDSAPAQQFSAQMLSGKMIFGDTIEINLDKRLPVYSNNYVGAYEARSLGSDGREFIAYVCEPQFTPRNRVGPAYAGIANPALINLVGSGIGRVAETQISRFVFIYESMLGKPIAEADMGLAMGMKPERVMSKIVAPLINVLKDLRDNDIVHGGIRPTNLFDGGKENFDHVVLGEALALPPSMAQPLICEPVDRALAQPTGRGMGVNQDDLYSLGVTLALLLRTRDPMRAKSEAEILESKMQHGSYATLVPQDDHFNGATVELLRGLLYDDWRQRWTLDEALSWLDGRRLSPKQAAKKTKAARPLHFNGKSYLYASPLARDMFLRPLEAVQLIESGELFQWIKRSLSDEAMLVRYEAALAGAQERGQSSLYHDKLIARVGIAIDPDGPIRYKNVSLTGEGLATALAEAFVTGKDIGTYAEIFSSTILSFWMTCLTDLNVDMASFVTRFDACRNFIRQPGLGFGLERVLYFLNADVHCLSPIVCRYYARTPEEFLLACESVVSNKSTRPERLLDRHSLAFLCVKDRKVAEPFLYDLSSREPHRHAMGTLQCLASIQRYAKIGPMRNLSEWMADFIEPVYARFHDRDIRKDLRQKIADLRDKGDLARMLAVLENGELMRLDMLGFRRAMHEYKSLTQERDLLHMQANEGKYYGRREGREFSVVVSGVLAAILIAGIIILYMNGARIL